MKKNQSPPRTDRNQNQLRGEANFVHQGEPKIQIKNKKTLKEQRYSYQIPLPPSRLTLPKYDQGEFVCSEKK